MAVYVYDKKEDVPKDVPYIHDADAYFIICGDTDVPHLADILDWVETAKPYDNVKFTDRFGTQLYYSELSTGSKILLLIDKFKYDVAVNVVEAGISVFEYIALNDLPCRIVLSEVGKLEYCTGAKFNIYYKGKFYETVESLLEEVYY